jgi:hypothetical protein
MTTNGLVTSNEVAVTVVCNLAGVCIDIFDTGTGKLFTNSPSVAYLDSIGGSATIGIRTEKGTDGPIGDFYLFDWNYANALCDTYNTLSLDGRTNWRLATKDELKVELYDEFGNMFTARGWPTSTYYWSVTSEDFGTYYGYYFVNLHYGWVNIQNQYDPVYASCVSNPYPYPSR